MTDDVRVIYRKDPSHHCQLPGWWQRRKLHLGFGSLVECTVCGARWAFDSPWGDTGWYRVYDPENLPQPSPGPAPGAPVQYRKESDGTNHAD